MERGSICGGAAGGEGNALSDLADHGAVTGVRDDLDPSQAAAAGEGLVVQELNRVEPVE
jgi:hypothetical protein